MTKKIFAILTVLVVLAMPMAVVAQGTPPPTLPPDAESINEPAEWLILLETIAQWVFAFLMVVVVFIVLLAAFNFLTAGGDPGKIQTARSMLIWAAIGIIVAILAFVFDDIVRGFVGVDPAA